MLTYSLQTWHLATPHRYLASRDLRSPLLDFTTFLRDSGQFLNVLQIDFRQGYTAHLRRSVISTMLRTIPAMKRYTFLSFASMMFIIISIKSTIAFVTMRIFAQDPPSDAQPWSWCPSTRTSSIFSRTLENNHLRFIQRHHLNLVLVTQCFLKLFQFPYTTRAFFHTCQSM